MLYLITGITYLSLICFYNKKIDFQVVHQSLLPISSLLFLWFIELYTSLRIKIRDFRERLNEVVDGFYTNKEFLKKPHKIYSGLIALINNRIKKDLIIDLFCFTVLPKSNNRIVIVNGSKFIWQFDFENKDLLKTLSDKDYKINVGLKIDSKSYKYNLVLPIDIEDVKYIFVFTTQKPIPFYYILIGFFRTLVPSFSKMSKILLSEKRLQEIKNEELQKLSIRSQYVTRATKTMHFIRNRLGPINNLMTMLDNKSTIDIEKAKGFESLLLSEKERAKNELQSIVNRANYLLEKSNNPFSFIKTELCSLERLYSILNRNINIFFPDIEIKTTKPTIIDKAFVAINEEGFELFLSDWLNNIKKYCNENVEIEFIVTCDTVSIEFWNDYLSDNATINQLISDFMSNDRNEIMKRTTHGLFQIKSTLEEMNINYNIEKINREQKNYIKFKVELNIVNNENSNI